MIKFIGGKTYRNLAVYVLNLWAEKIFSIIFVVFSKF